MIPDQIQNQAESGTLWLHWPDGRQARFGHDFLRQYCPCPSCRQAERPRVPVRLLAIQAQGYGLQLQFSDGHQRGIYPWPYWLKLAEEASATGV